MSNEPRNWAKEIWEKYVNHDMVAPDDGSREYAIFITTQIAGNLMIDNGCPREIVGKIIKSILVISADALLSDLKLNFTNKLLAGASEETKIGGEA